MKVIDTKNAPAAIGPYSQAIVANGFVYTSGQIPINPQTGAVEGKTITEQAEQVMKNLKAVLEAAGSDFTKAVKTLCFLKTITILRRSTKCTQNILRESPRARASLL